MNNTKEFTLNFAVEAGYAHENKSIDLVKVSEKLNEIANEVEEKTGLYISGMLSENKVIYKTDWGRPIGGENGLTYVSTANPAFVEDLQAWENACLEFAKQVKETFQQSTVTIIMKEVGITYLN